MEAVNGIFEVLIVRFERTRVPERRFGLEDVLHPVVVLQNAGIVITNDIIAEGKKLAYAYAIANKLDPGAFSSIVAVSRRWMAPDALYAAANS